jgi:molybdopterin converting factor small subunit
MAITVKLPGPLAEPAGGARSIAVDVDASGAPATVGALLDALASSHPALERRIRDERGEVRRFVNLYVGDDDVRHLEGQSTTVRDGDVVHVLPSVAGG